MRIVADENIPLVREAFAGLGDVLTLPGRGLSPADLDGADALLVRSVTPVNESLLVGTAVRFVGTATSGADHIQVDWLRGNDIGFGHALGCNAVSVAEYVLAGLVHWAAKTGRSLAESSLGIVGFGNVGKAVASRTRALGMEVLINDPPLERGTAELIYRPMEDILACDVVTLHVPLERGGLDPTYHLANERFFEAMKDGALFINTSRGEVVDEAALKVCLNAGKLSGCVLDVWANEPCPDVELAGMVDIATPHIAGYSLDGKVRGTQMIHDAFCGHLGVDHNWDPSPLLPRPVKPRLYVSGDDAGAVSGCVRAAYDIMADDSRFRAGLKLGDDERGPEFDRQRREYPVRREFGAVTVMVSGEDRGVSETLARLGFRVECSESD